MEPKGYTDIESIQNYLLIDIDAEFHDQINEWIMGVEEYIDHETNRDFTAADEEDVSEDRTFDGDRTNTLDIDPAILVDEVRFSEDGDPIDTDQYVLYPIRGGTVKKIKLKNLRFPLGDQNIYVKAKWGYEEVPMDIKLAATVLVSGIINNAWDSAGEVASMSIGRYSVTYKTKAQVDDFNKIDDILAYNKKYTF